MGNSRTSASVSSSPHRNLQSCAHQMRIKEAQSAGAGAVIFSRICKIAHCDWVLSRYRDTSPRPCSEMHTGNHSMPSCITTLFLQLLSIRLASARPSAAWNRWRVLNSHCCFQMGTALHPAPAVRQNGFCAVQRGEEALECHLIRCLLAGKAGTVGAVVDVCVHLQQPGAICAAAVETTKRGHIWPHRLAESLMTPGTVGQGSEGHAL